MAGAKAILTPLDFLKKNHPCGFYCSPFYFPETHKLVCAPKASERPRLLFTPAVPAGPLRLSVRGCLLGSAREGCTPQHPRKRGVGVGEAPRRLVPHRFPRTPVGLAQPAAASRVTGARGSACLPSLFHFLLRLLPGHVTSLESSSQWAPGGMHTETASPAAGRQEKLSGVEPRRAPEPRTPAQPRLTRALPLAPASPWPPSPLLLEEASQHHLLVPGGVPLRLSPLPTQTSLLTFSGRPAARSTLPGTAAHVQKARLLQ
ncbi:uncharacterized protein [Equus caballus]|uniref:uncharacterized protein isoform X2 n=1 Tax=Equus caballus TaxID=9796 RepID=UPI0038B33DE8